MVSLPFGNTLKATRICELDEEKYTFFKNNSILKVPLKFSMIQTTGTQMSGAIYNYKKDYTLENVS